MAFNSNKTKYVTVDAELEYAQVFLENRDMGNEQVDHSDTDGVYKVTLILDEDNKNKAIEAGCPAKQGAFEQFKAFERDGNTLYKFVVRRPHIHPKFMVMDEQGNPTDERLILGPPQTFDLNKARKAWEEAGEKGRLDQYAIQWTINDGLIGNGTKAKVKLSIATGEGKFGKAKGKKFTKVQLMGIGITNLVEYEGASSGTGGW
jgi:hypothetical protein